MNQSPSKMRSRIGTILLALTAAGIVLYKVANRQLNEQAALRLESRLASLELKTGIKTVPVGFSVGFGTMRIDSLQIILPTGDRLSRKLSAPKVDPDPDIVELLQQIEPALRSLISELRTSSDEPKSKSIMPMIVRWFLPTRVVFDIAKTEIIADRTSSNSGKKELILGATEFHVRLDRRTPRIHFHAKELQLTGFVPETNVSGHVRLWPKTGAIELTASQTPDAKYHGWGLRIRTGVDTRKVEVSINGAHMPPSLASLFGNFIVPSTDTTFESNLELNQLGTEMVSFNASMKFRDLYVHNKAIAPTEIGPLHLDANFNGTFDPASSELIIDHGRIQLPAQLDFEPAERNMAQRSNFDFEVAGALEPAIIVNLRANGPVALPKPAQRLLTRYFPPSSKRSPPAIWSVRAFVSRTPCQALVDILPGKLAPALHDFTLTGDFMGILTVTWPKERPADFQLQISHDEFTCQVAHEPDLYATKTLNGPLSVQRRSRGMPNRNIDLSAENPAFAPFRNISRSFVTTVVAAEDTSFWNHTGVASFTFLDALRDNLAVGHLARGGSTITMQLVKNLLLTHDRTASRKIQEIFLAWHLGQTLTRERILELYANVIEFGPNIFGVGEAADFYFGKTAEGLTLKESVFLVNLLPAPVSRAEAFCRHHQPTENFSLLMDNLLTRMRTLKIINDDQWNRATAERLIFRSDDDAIAKLCHPTKEAT